MGQADYLDTPATVLEGQQIPIASGIIDDENPSHVESTDLGLELLVIGREQFFYRDKHRPRTPSPSSFSMSGRLRARVASIDPMIIGGERHIATPRSPPSQIVRASACLQ